MCSKFGKVSWHLGTFLARQQIPEVPNCRTFNRINPMKRSNGKPFCMTQNKHSNRKYLSDGQRSLNKQNKGKFLKSGLLAGEEDLYMWNIEGSFRPLFQHLHCLRKADTLRSIYARDLIDLHPLALWLEEIPTRDITFLTETYQLRSLPLIEQGWISASPNWV